MIFGSLILVLPVALTYEIAKYWEISNSVGNFERKVISENLSNLIKNRPFHRFEKKLH